jgi:hypothetical protein
LEKAMIKLGLIESSVDLSIEWFGREKSYVRGLKSGGREPSATVLARCAAQLRLTARRLERSKRPEAAAIVPKIMKLSDLCTAHLFRIENIRLPSKIEELATGKPNDPLAARKASIKNQQKQLAIQKKQIAAQQAQQKNNAAQAALSKVRSKP